jgi:hypothetical protein
MAGVDQYLNRRGKPRVSPSGLAKPRFSIDWGGIPDPIGGIAKSEITSGQVLSNIFLLCVAISGVATAAHYVSQWQTPSGHASSIGSSYPGLPSLSGNTLDRNWIASIAKIGENGTASIFYSSAGAVKSVLSPDQQNRQGGGHDTHRHPAHHVFGDSKIEGTFQQQLDDICRGYPLLINCHVDEYNILHFEEGNYNMNFFSLNFLYSNIVYNSNLTGGIYDKDGTRINDYQMNQDDFDSFVQTFLNVQRIGQNDYYANANSIDSSNILNIFGHGEMSYKIDAIDPQNPGNSLVNVKFGPQENPKTAKISLKYLLDIFSQSAVTHDQLIERGNAAATVRANAEAATETMEAIPTNTPTDTETPQPTYTSTVTPTINYTSTVGVVSTGTPNSETSASDIFGELLLGATCLGWSGVAGIVAASAFRAVKKYNMLH